MFKIINISSWVLAMISLLLIISVYFDFQQISDTGRIDIFGNGLGILLNNLKSIILKILISFYLMFIAIFLSTKA